jgi:hypothetical protein
LKSDPFLAILRLFDSMEQAIFQPESLHPSVGFGIH